MSAPGDASAFMHAHAEYYNRTGTNPGPYLALETRGSGAVSLCTL